MKHYDVIIIGGGSAGLSAAVTLKQHGVQNVVILEKDRELGGILQQCIHNGFGLQTFKEQLSGPSYAERYIDMARKEEVEVHLDSMVTHISKDKEVEYVNEQEGHQTISADSIIFAVGCYERNRGAIQIPGSRPTGIFTAGQAQRYLNIDGYLVGKKVFILGSGDIGLIMARRMTLEGAKVYGVVEIMPYSNGLPRNIKQCLEDFDIPLFLSHTVTNIYGKDRLEGIEVSQVDEQRIPIPGTEKYYEVDTLLLSVGLIPENHLAEEIGIELDSRTKGPIVDENYMTSVEGIFACGNGLHVHDLVDYVSMEAARTAMGVIRYHNQPKASKEIRIQVGNGISYTVPTKIHTPLHENCEVFFRVTKQVEQATIGIFVNGELVHQEKKRNLMPSVMETILLKKEDVLSANEIELKMIEEE